MPKRPRKHLRQPLVIIFGDCGDRDKVQIDSALPMKFGAFSCHINQMVQRASFNCRQHVHIHGASRETVKRRYYEAPETMKFDLFAETIVHLR